MQILECQTRGYPARTIENILKSNVTIAIAKDFNTPGERLTRNTCIKAGRGYIPIDFNNKILDHTIIAKAVEVINKFCKESVIINIAGNGIYSLDETNEEIITYISDLLEVLMLQEIPEIIAVRSGGQTGIDECGVKAAEMLGLNTTVLAPKGWMFRNKQGRYLIGNPF